LEIARVTPPLVGGDRGGRVNRPMPNNLTKYARKLRRNSTQAETMLWRRLKARQLDGIKFRRQQPIGTFIVDFVSLENRIVIELDGGQHTAMRCKDRGRDRWLADEGFTVLRFWNNDVFENLDGVLTVIRQKCMGALHLLPIPPLTPPVKGGGQNTG
jgi:very-short-patch-repair endonuclease